MTLQLKLIAILASLLVIAGAAWKIRYDGQAAERARQTQAQARELQRAAQVSRETAEARAVEQVQVQQEAQRVETIIRDRIVRVPVAAAPADPDILRAVSAAHDAAICAAQRVQRAECRPAATPAAEGQ